MRSRFRSSAFLSPCLLLILFACAAVSAQVPDPLPRPDGKPADMSKPVQVYILLGQSNMLGFGKIKGGDGSLEYAVKEKKLYPYLVDERRQLDRAQGRP